MCEGGVGIVLFINKLIYVIYVIHVHVHYIPHVVHAFMLKGQRMT